MATIFRDPLFSSKRKLAVRTVGFVSAGLCLLYLQTPTPVVGKSFQQVKKVVRQNGFVTDNFVIWAVPNTSIPNVACSTGKPTKRATLQNVHPQQNLLTTVLSAAPTPPAISSSFYKSRTINRLNTSFVQGMTEVVAPATFPAVQGSFSPPSGKYLQNVLVLPNLLETVLATIPVPPVVDDEPARGSRLFGIREAITHELVTKTVAKPRVLVPEAGAEVVLVGGRKAAKYPSVEITLKPQVTTVVWSREQSRTAGKATQLEPQVERFAMVQNTIADAHTPKLSPDISSVVDITPLKAYVKALVIRPKAIQNPSDEEILALVATIRAGRTQSAPGKSVNALITARILDLLRTNKR